MSYWHLQTATVAASTDRSDVSRQRQLAVNDDAEVTGCPGLGDTTTERAYR